MHGANSSVYCVSRWVDTWHTTKYNIAMHTAVSRSDKFVLCIHSGAVQLEFMLVEPKKTNAIHRAKLSQAKQAYYVMCVCIGCLKEEEHTKRETVQDRER